MPHHILLQGIGWCIYAVFLCTGVVNETLARCSVRNSPGAKMPYIGDSPHVQVALQSWFASKLNCLQPSGSFCHVPFHGDLFQPRHNLVCQQFVKISAFVLPSPPFPTQLPPKKCTLWHKSFPPQSIAIYNQTLALWQIGKEQYVSRKIVRRDIDGP